MSNSNFIRVTKHNPCPVCGKPDWCLISRDGKTAICARAESDKPAGNKGAGWVHNLEKPAPVPPYVPPATQAVKASPDSLDNVYRALLQCLDLSQAHRDNLQSRGLTDLEIKCLGYKTLPENLRGYLPARLEGQGYKMSGIPGFYFRYYWKLAGPAGILIPVRDMSRLIQGMQIRRDNISENKYVWLSSSKYPGGSSPGAPVHVAVPLPGELIMARDYLKLRLDGILITEGPLKADIAALRLGCLTLAVPGVSNWAGVLPIIKAIQPPPGRIIIAFDMDKSKNDYVRSYRDELTAALLRMGIRTFEADWDTRKKGIDDLCLRSP